MSSNDPRLCGNLSRRAGPYRLEQLPDRVLFEISRQIVHRLAVGHNDLEGDDFGTIFANAIGGEHRARPLGIADVELNGRAWSIKTVHAKSPPDQKSVRLISGRNSQYYSLGIADPHVDPASAADAVLSIWNARVDEALNQYNDLRIVVMIRNMQTRQFRIFEEEALRFTPGDFRWPFNERGNLEGSDRTTGQHRFTWQPHGSQFTVLRSVPASARRFSIDPNVPMVDVDAILNSVGFNLGWITVYNAD